MDRSQTGALRSALSDRYRVEHEIGRGGSAVVYLASDLRHRRQVAIKVLYPELAARVGADRFLREIDVAAGLTHPHILPLLESGRAGEFLYYVMPWVEGESLDVRLARDGAFPVDRAVRIVSEVADALAYAHTRGVVHRDIKPGNILLVEGHAVISDFGLARIIGDGGTSITSTSMAMGTPLYMSPEQASGGREIDGRSDIYSLGCVLYELLAGDPPFTGPAAIAVMSRKLRDPLPSLRHVRTDVTPALELALRKALALEPDHRFATADQFADALNRSLMPNGDQPAALRRTLFAAAMGALVLFGAVRLFGPGADGDRALPAMGETGLTEASAVRVGVLPAERPGVDTSGANDDRLVQHLFSLELSRHRGLAVMDPLSLNSYLQRNAGGDARDTYGELRAAGLAYALRSTVMPRGSGFDVTYVLADTRTGNVAFRGTFHVRGDDDLPAGIRAAGDRLTRALEEAGGLTQALDVEPWLAGSQTPLAATRAFLQGIEYAYRNVPGGGQYFDEATRIDPKFIAPRIWLVSGAAAAGDTAAARDQVEVLRQLRRAATPFEQAMIGWAEAVASGDVVAKAEHLRIALSHSPRNNILLFTLASTLVELGRYGDAAESARAAVESGWRYPRLFPLWGVVAIETGQVAGLRETLEDALDVSPPSPYLFGLLEALAAYDGDRPAQLRYATAFRQSVGDARRAAAYREMVPVYRSLAEHARSAGDAGRSVMLLGMAVDADPASPVVRLELARALAERGEHDSAARYYLAVRDSMGDRAEALYLMSEVAGLIGRSAEAARHLDRYLELDPDGPDAVRVRERLRALQVQSSR